MRFSRVLASAWFVTCVLVTPLQAGPFTEIVAFGDSLTDTGNLSAIGLLPRCPSRRPLYC